MPICQNVMILLAFCAGGGLAAVGILGLVAWQDHKSAKESERLTCALEALIDEDADPKIRALLLKR